MAREAALRARGVVFGRLPVRVPFHSALVEPMRAPWLQRHGQLAADTAAEFWRVIREPFDFPAQLAGLDAQRPCVLVDVGPSATLANWIRHGAPRPHWRTFGILSPWGGDVARLQQVLDLAGAHACSTEAVAS